MLAPSFPPLPASAFGAAHHFAALVRHFLKLATRHTGVPAVFVAALALVISFRIARKMARLVAEVSLAAAVLFLFTRLGWIAW